MKEEQEIYTAMAVINHPIWDVDSNLTPNAFKFTNNHSFISRQDFEPIRLVTMTAKSKKKTTADKSQMAVTHKKSNSEFDKVTRITASDGYFSAAFGLYQWNSNYLHMTSTKSG